MENNVVNAEKKEKRPGLAVTTTVLAAGIVIVLGASRLWAGVIEPKTGMELPALVSDILRQMVVPYGVGLGLCLLLYRLLPAAERPSDNIRAFTAGDIVKGTIVQTGVGIWLAIAVNIAVMILTGAAAAQADLELYTPYMAFLLLVFNPVFEELLFRKLTIDRLRRFGKYPAVIISAVMFALPHIMSQGARGAAMTLVAGLVWGYIYYRTDNLLPCIVMHSLFNVLMGYGAGFLIARGGAFVALYFLVYVLILPVISVIILIKHGRVIFAQDNTEAQKAE